MHMWRTSAMSSSCNQGSVTPSAQRVLKNSIFGAENIVRNLGSSSRSLAHHRNSPASAFIKALITTQTHKALAGGRLHVVAGAQQAPREAIDDVLWQCLLKKVKAELSVQHRFKPADLWSAHIFIGTGSVVCFEDARGPDGQVSGVHSTWNLVHSTSAQQIESRSSFQHFVLCRAVSSAPSKGCRIWSR